MNLQGKGQGQIQNNNIKETVTNPYKKTTKRLEPGINATTFQGGVMMPVMYKEVLAGEYIESYNIDQITRILTPLVPTMGKVFITTKAYFVPHTRVWKDAEKYLADKNSLENQEDTNLGILPTVKVLGNNTAVKQWKRTLAARYGVPYNATDTTINLLPIRGYRAIMNDFVINKSYELPDIEWNDTEPTQAEINAVNAYNIDTPNIYTPGAYILEDAPYRNNYFTDIRPNISRESDHSVINDGTSGWEYDEIPSNVNIHLDWETQFNYEKQSELNANLNDWDIIANMGGTKPIIANQVQYLGKLDYEMNYQQITQSSQQTDGEQTPLGTTGSFSYTRANGTIFSHKSFPQHGYIHILVSLNLERYQDNGTPRELLKSRIIDIFKPGIAKKETQLMYMKEIGNGYFTTDSQTAGFQKPWAEYERMPVFTSGEMQATAAGGVTAAHWHNMLDPFATTETIDSNFFRSKEYTNKVLARNNILNKLDENNEFIEDPIMQISEHNVRTALPIDPTTVAGTQKGNTRR